LHPLIAKAIPRSDAWLYEPKLDGYRLQIGKDAAALRSEHLLGSKRTREATARASSSNSSNRLREHHISDCKMAFGHEAPTSDLSAFCVVFVMFNEERANAVMLSCLPSARVNRSAGARS